MPKPSALPLALLLLVAQPSLATPPPPQIGLAFDNPHGIRDCSGLPARVDVITAAGRELRAEPNDRSAKVGWLRPSRDVHGGRVLPTFPLVQSYDGYLLVRHGSAASHRDTWLLGLGVSAGVSATRGYAFPDASSEVVIRSSDGARLDAHAELIDIIACDHDWILGRWRIDQPERIVRRDEIAIWPDPPVVEFWTPACDRRSPGCDTPPGTRPHRRGVRDPLYQEEGRR